MNFDALIISLTGINHPVWIYLTLLGILLLCGFGLPVPEDIILISGGYLAYLEVVDLAVFMPLALIGVLAGDSTMFLIGKKFGYPLLKKKFVRRFLSSKNLVKAEQAFEEYGDRIFFVARFLPGLRAPIYFTGGALRAKFYKFFIFDFIAALISVPVWILAAYFGGAYIESVIHVGKNVQYGIIGFIILIVIIAAIWRITKNKNGNSNKNKDQ